MNVVVLTGAGVSVESGLATFRAEDGLWAGHNIEDVCTPEAFARDPDRVCRFYDERERLAGAFMVGPTPGQLNGCQPRSGSSKRRTRKSGLIQTRYAREETFIGQISLHPMQMIPQRLGHKNPSL